MLTISIAMVVTMTIITLFFGFTIGMVVARHILTHPESKVRELLLTKEEE